MKSYETAPDKPAGQERKIAPPEAAARPVDFCLPDSCTLSAAVRSAKHYLYACGVADADTDAWYLLEQATGLSRAVLLAEQRAPFSGKHREAYISLIRARGRRIPLQYLTGEQEFMGLVFCVTPDVLIPRQDTETLVEEALARLAESPARPYKDTGKVPARPDRDAGKSFVQPDAALKKDTARPCRILDLCTGSGCIAVSLAKLARHDGTDGVEVWASDCSAAALAVAEENAKCLGAEVHFVRSDLFAGLDPAKPFDMILSNPPYITAAEMETLEEEVRLHEPRTALYGGADGLDFYRKIIRESRAYLRPQGLLLLEIGCAQGDAVTALLKENGFADVQVKQDLAGRDRVAAGRLF